MRRNKHPERTQAIALDAKWQKRKHAYLHLPHATLVQLLCQTRWTLMRRNQHIKTLKRQLKEAKGR